MNLELGTTKIQNARHRRERRELIRSDGRVGARQLGHERRLADGRKSDKAHPRHTGLGNVEPYFKKNH